MIPGFNGFTDGRCRQGDEEGVDSHAAGRWARARYEQGLEIKQIIHWEGLDSGKEQSARDECLTTAKDFIHLKKIIISLRNIIWELIFQKIT